jgi:ATP-dependent RNA helicase DeaD
MTDTTLVPPALAEALATRGYETLTQVQSAVIAPELAGQDLLVSAQTGSGKTVAFGLAMAGDLLGTEAKFTNADAPLALIVAPTRELAQQVARELQWLYASTGARLATCVGGMDMRDEKKALARGAHIVVGTPGRLSDHIKRGSLVTTDMRVVILDEADEMLDMGFRDELEHILQDTPASRRTMLFSATVPKGIAALAGRYQRNAVRVTTEAEKSQHVDIEYKALLVAPGDEENAIVNIVRHSDSESALVFCTTRAAVNKLMSRMGNRGFPVVALSGELSQKERSNALQSLRDGRARVCIATDVAARGLDLQNLGLVIHADLPRDPQTLLHRSGRTGRAGRKGVSALLVAPKGRRRVERLLRDAKIDATWGKPPTAEEINALDDARLLADPALSRPIHESEADMIAKLIEAHGAEQVVAAFLRKSREGRSAPEDLRDVDDRAPAPRKERGDRPDWTDREPREKRPRAERKGFENAAWISLNIGRKKSAEARWLLPMLCKAGGLSREDIGAIRINPSSTHVELTKDAAERFFSTLGEGAALEKGIRAFPLDGPPPKEQGDDRPPRGPRSPHVKPAFKHAKVREEGAWTPDAKKSGKPGKPKWEGAPAPTAEPSLSDYIQHDGPKDKKPYKGKPKAANGKPGGKPGFKGKPAAGKGAKPAKPYKKTSRPG